MQKKQPTKAWTKPTLEKLGRLRDVAGMNSGTTESGGCGSGGGSCHS